LGLWWGQKPTTMSWEESLEGEEFIIQGKSGRRRLFRFFLRRRCQKRRKQQGFSLE
jgi:hypothetical protein